MGYELSTDDIIEIGRYRGHVIRMAVPNADGDWVHHCVKDSRRLWNQDALDSALRYIPEHPGVVDVGSHSGSSAVWFARIAGASSVTAIEPDPFSYDVLLNNIALNSLTDIVRAVHSAVWDDDGCAYMEAVSVSDRACSQYRPCASGVSWAVPCARLDAIMQGPSVKVDVLCIEMEGYEYLALHGGRELIRENQPVIIATFFSPGAVTVNPAYDPMQGHVRFMAELAGLGYTAVASHGHTTVFLPEDRE